MSVLRRSRRVSVDDSAISDSMMILSVPAGRLTVPAGSIGHSEQVTGTSQIDELDKKSKHGHFVRVYLDTRVQHTIRWDKAIDVPVGRDGKGGAKLRPGSCNLYQFPVVQHVRVEELRKSNHYVSVGQLEDASTLDPPKPLKDDELEVLKRLVSMMIHGENCDMTSARDLFGATPLHGLLVANTTESLDAAMAMFRARPELMCQTHISGPPMAAFEDENCLIVAIVNRHEEHVLEMIDLAKKLKKDDRRKLFLTQPIGPFFRAAPMKNYGGTPISYMACFGMKRAITKLLHEESIKAPDGCGIDLNDVEAMACQLTGMMPLHAVVQNGLTDMFNFLIDLEDPDMPDLPEIDFDLRVKPELKCWRSKIKWSEAGQYRGLTALQLTAVIGSQRMFRHVLKRHKYTLWKWGPAQAHHISLDEIDSAGEGGDDVMELIGRKNAPEATQQMLLDDFMGGFLFQLYEQKWKKFGRAMHFVQLGIYSSYVGLLCYVAFLGRRGYRLEAPAGEFLLENYGIVADAAKLEEDESHAVDLLTARAWADTPRGPLYAMLFFVLLGAEEEARELFIYFSNRDVLDFLHVPDELSFEGVRKQLHTHETKSASTMRVVRDYWLELQERAFGLKLMTWTLTVVSSGLILSLDPDASSYTHDQLVRAKTIPLLFSPSLLFGLLYFMYELFVILESVGRFSMMFTKMFKENVSTWFVLFIFFLLMFWLAIFMVMPRGGVDEVVDPSIALLWNLILFSFTGDQNFEFEFGLEGDYTSDWDWHGTNYFVSIAMPRVLLIFLYLLFMVISLVVLLNLLIAMMSTTYQEVEDVAAVRYRHKKARRTLRMELLTRIFIKPEKQRAGTKSASGKFVHEVITLERNVEGQVVAGGSDIFADNTDKNLDGVPDEEQVPEWARRIETQLASLGARGKWGMLLDSKSQPHAPGHYGGAKPAVPSKSQQPQPQPQPQPYPAPTRAAPAAPYVKQRADTMDFSGSIEPTLRVHSGGLAAAICEPPLPPIHQHRTLGANLCSARHPHFGHAPEPLRAGPVQRAPPQRPFTMQAVVTQDGSRPGPHDVLGGAPSSHVAPA